MQTHLDLFSGIGGFALAAQWNGLRTIGFSEIDPYCCRVLEEHWPDVPNFGDIRNVTKETVANAASWQFRQSEARNGRQDSSRGSEAAGLGGFRTGGVDLLTGGFPCQPFSSAGKRRGKDDDHALWPEMRRVVADLRPHWVLAENVPGIISMELDTVLSDLEDIDYTVGAVVVPACAADAEHRRDRVWIVAHAACRGTGPEEQRGQWNGAKSPGETVANADKFNRGTRTGRQHGAQTRHSDQALADTSSIGCENGGGIHSGLCGQATEKACAEIVGGAWRWSTEPDVGRVAYGVPKRVDRLQALGNAIVPQVAAEIIRYIIETDRRCGLTPGLALA